MATPFIKPEKQRYLCIIREISGSSVQWDTLQLFQNNEGNLYLLTWKDL